MGGNMSAINTALPRISDAIAIDMVDKGWKCVPLAINTRINVTKCSATKKKIVGGRIAKNSSLIFSSILCMGLLSLDAVFASLFCWLGLVKSSRKTDARDSLANQFHRLAQWCVRRFDESIQRPIHFQNQKNRGRDRECADEKHGYYHTVRRSKQSKANKKTCKPKDQHHDECRWEGGLLAFHQEQSSLQYIITELHGLCETRFLKVVCRSKLAQFRLKELTWIV